MSIKKLYKYFLLVYTFCLLSNLFSKTSDWKVIWDRNAQTDSIDHYILYRQIGSVATVNSDIIGQIQEPVSQTQDSVMYLDSDIQTGIHYFYTVQAVNMNHVSSPLSGPVGAAIPRILINQSLKLTVDSTYQIGLNNTIHINDPDHIPSLMRWNLSGSNQIEGSINPSNNILTINTPSDTTISETFQFTVTDPHGFFDRSSMTITLTKKTIVPPPPPPPPPTVDGETDKVIAYPVPFVASDPPPCECITFQIPVAVESAKLLIFTIMGDLVFTASDLSNTYDWAVVNSDGRDISPGVYIYYVHDGENKQVLSGKVVIIR